MGRKELIFKILGLVSTVAFGVASIVIELRRTNKITDEDKDDIAERVAEKIKSVKAPKPKVETAKTV